MSPASTHSELGCVSLEPIGSHRASCASGQVTAGSAQLGTERGQFVSHLLQAALAASAPSASSASRPTKNVAKSP